MSAGSRDRDRAWCVAFLRHLPPELRTAPDDPRLVAAAAQARGNGWEAVTLATAVAARDYTGALHPSLLATQRLHELGCIPPPPAPTERRDWGTDRESHCGRPSCDCTHDGGCFKGWVDAPGTATTIPCRNCRPVLHLRLRDIPPPGQRTPGDLAHIRSERGRG